MGEGAHFFEHRDHAEIAALKAAASAGRSVEGATAYVTLEPCSHHGRTGPCADALVRAGIARCVIATVDPNPLVSGQGLAKLRAAALEVCVCDPASALAQRARRLNDAFAFAIQHGRPFVTLKAALSLDGKLAPPPVSRSVTEPFWLTGPAARADVAHLRHASDALLTGIGTVLADDPKLTDRTGLARRRPLLRVVLDSGLRIPPDSHLVRYAANDLLLVCSTGADPARRKALARNPLEILALPNLHTPESLRAVLDHLQQQGIRSVLAEAGSALNRALLEARLVDKVILYFADRELGEGAVSFTSNQLPPQLLQEQLTAPTRTSFPHPPTEDIRITGYLHDPWQAV